MLADVRQRVITKLSVVDLQSSSRTEGTPNMNFLEQLQSLLNDYLLNNPWMSREMFGNPMSSYVVAGIALVLVTLTMWTIKIVVINRLQAWAKKTATDLDDFLIVLLNQLGLGVYLVVAVYIASHSLVLPGSLSRILHLLIVVVLTFKAIQILQQVVQFFLEKWMGRTEGADPTTQAAAKNLGIIVKVFLWIGGVMFLLDNLGIDVTAAIAGLGITGIAVALAAQTMLKDTFAAFCIFIDKPFKVGDTISMGDLMGAVEYIGFKTTRIRSLSGEQIVFPNSTLTDNQVRNFKRMEQRRIVFKIGIVYQTSVDKVRETPGLIKAIIDTTPNTKFDRAHFISYGDFALIYEVVYYVLNPDYLVYVTAQQEINFRLMEEFAKRGIEFAYPTQQLYVTSTTALPAPAR
jgi:small-conductance mechanosensitive channel